MKRAIIHTLLSVAALSATFLPGILLASQPPALISYQGVLRNTTGAPQDGLFDMVFQFYDSEADGTLLLTDSHTLASGGQVEVDQGLFSVLLGGGTVTAGAETSLAAMFQNRPQIYLRVSVNGDAIPDRIRILSSGYSINSDSLDGVDSAAFLRSDVSDTFTGGALTINTAAGKDLRIMEDRLDRDSTLDETFSISNGSPSGSMTLQVDGDLQIGLDATNDKDSITFDANAESLAWDDTQDRFELSNELSLPLLTVGNGAMLDFNSISLAAPAPRASDVSASNDLFIGGDLEVESQVYAIGTIVVGDSTPAANQVFSSFGEASLKDEASINSSTDVYIGGELEVDSALFLNGTIDSPTGTLDILLNVNGDVHIGDNLTANGQDLTIGDGGLCVDSDGSCVAPADGSIKAFAYEAAGHSDIAEVYPSEEALAPGDVVVIAGGPGGLLGKSTSANEQGIISVISTAPGFILGGPTDEELATRGLDPDLGPNFGHLLLVPGTYPVVLMGRAPVKVSDENGAIVRGDPLAASSKPGVAMRATQQGSILGRALEAWAGPGQGRIEVLIMPGWLGQPSTGATGGAGAGNPEATGLAATPAIAGLGGGSARDSIALDGQGDLYARSFRPMSGTLAATYPVSEKLEPGDVVVVDTDRTDRIRRGRRDADPAVVGVVVAEAGIVLPPASEATAPGRADLVRQLEEARAAGDVAAQLRVWKELERNRDEVQASVAISGITSCKVDAGYGAIRVGDLLATSPTPGHAMRADDPRPGTVLGKALEPLEQGTGTVRVLVMLR